MLLHNPLSCPGETHVPSQASRTADLIRRRCARVNSLTALLNHACEQMLLSSEYAVCRNENERSARQELSLSRL